MAKLLAFIILALALVALTFAEQKKEDLQAQAGHHHHHGWHHQGHHGGHGYGGEGKWGGWGDYKFGYKFHAGGWHGHH